MTSGKVSCLADSATTHIVLREFIYFTNFIPKNAPLTTLSGPSNLIEGYGKAIIMLSNGTILTKAHHPDCPIKSIRLDNAGEFTSKTFDDYYMSVGVRVEHLVPYVHTQNGLAEDFIRRLQMIARSLVIRTKLPIAVWGHAILHATKLIRLRPIATQPFSALQFVIGSEPDISHLRVFCCEVYVPISLPLRTKMGPQ